MVFVTPFLFNYGVIVLGLLRGSFTRTAAERFESEQRIDSFCVRSAFTGAIGDVLFTALAVMVASVTTVVIQLRDKPNDSLYALLLGSIVVYAIVVAALYFWLPTLKADNFNAVQPLGMTTSRMLTGLRLALNTAAMGVAICAVSL